MSGAKRDPIAALAVFLTGQPTAVARLLADHVDDGRGYCRVCSVGAQRGNHTWPCSLHAAATAATHRRRSQ
ncbi:MAG TPA: hypothetical protein VGD67_23115 [Pseudonocardiaceae bacterium]